MGLDHMSAREEIIQHRGMFVGPEGVDWAGGTVVVDRAVEVLGGRSALRLR